MRVYKRGNVWWIDYFAGGQRVRESTGTTSKKRAQQLLAKRQAAVFEGRFDFQDIRQSPPFSAYADEYLETYSHHNKKASTYKRDRGLVANLRQFFGNRQLREINPMLIDHYKRRRLEAGRRPGTVNREVACLKHMFTVAIEWKKAFKNPVKEVRMLREDNEIVNPISDEDEALLLEAASPHLRDIVTCAIDTGMRRAELFDLRWSGVDLERRNIRIVKSKTDKKRDIPITDRLLQVFERLRDGSDSHVFASPRTGEKLTKIDTAWRRANERAGLKHKGYRFHDCRGTFITRLFEEGRNPITIMQLTGHSSLRMLERYARPGDQSRRDAIEALDARQRRQNTVDFERRSG